MACDPTAPRRLTSAGRSTMPPSLPCAKSTGRARRGGPDDRCRPDRPELVPRRPVPPADRGRSEEHTSELQSLMRISYAVFCLKKKKKKSEQPKISPASLNNQTTL